MTNALFQVCIVLHQGNLVTAVLSHDVTQTSWQAPHSKCAASLIIVTGSNHTCSSFHLKTITLYKQSFSAELSDKTQFLPYVWPEVAAAIRINLVDCHARKRETKNDSCKFPDKINKPQDYQSPGW